MSQTSYHSPISGFWYGVLPAALLGLGYLVWTSNGFLAGEVRAAVGPLLRLIGNIVKAFI